MAPLSSFSIGATAIDKGHRIGLKVDDELLFLQCQNQLAVGCRYLVTVAEEEGRRSVAANRYLWGPIYTTVEADTGSPKEVTHAAMCERFLKKQVFYVDKHTGLTVETWIVGGSSGLTPKQFHKFVEDVKLYFSEEHGMTFEDSEDYTRERADVMKPRRTHAA